MRHLLTILLLVLATACVPYSTHPLTPPDKVGLDQSIFGTWFWNEERESGYIHIGRDEKSGLLRVMMLSFDSGMELDVSEFSGHTSSLNGNQYLNLQWVDPPDEGSGYMFVKYTATADKLGISFMDSDPITAAIEQGVLQGEIKRQRWATSVQVTAAPTELKQFVQNNEKELFPEMKYLPRLNLPNMPSEQVPQSGSAQVPQ